MEQIKFNPEVELTHEDRAQIAHTLATPGFTHINRILRAEVDKFVIDLINVPEDNDALVIAKHRLSKAAAQYYQIVSSRLNAEAQQYLREAGGRGEPVDHTEGQIDLGESAYAIQDEQGFEFDSSLLEEETH